MYILYVCIYLFYLFKLLSVIGWADWFWYLRNLSRTLKNVFGGVKTVFGHIPTPLIIIVIFFKNVKTCFCKSLIFFIHAFKKITIVLISSLPIDHLHFIQKTLCNSKMDPSYDRFPCPDYLQSDFCILEKPQNHPEIMSNL